MTKYWSGIVTIKCICWAQPLMPSCYVMVSRSGLCRLKDKFLTSNLSARHVCTVIFVSDVTSRYSAEDNTECECWNLGAWHWGPFWKNVDFYCSRSPQIHWRKGWHELLEVEQLHVTALWVEEYVAVLETGLRWREVSPHWVPHCSGKVVS